MKERVRGDEGNGSRLPAAVAFGGVMDEQSIGTRYGKRDGMVKWRRSYVVIWMSLRSFQSPLLWFSLQTALINRGSFR